MPVYCTLYSVQNDALVRPKSTFPSHLDDIKKCNWNRWKGTNQELFINISLFLLWNMHWNENIFDFLPRFIMGNVFNVIIRVLFMPFICNIFEDFIIYWCCIETQGNRGDVSKQKVNFSGFLYCSLYQYASGSILSITENGDCIIVLNS